MATGSRWRRQARQVIARVLAGLPTGAPLAEKRAAVSAAYPFGERKMHPYKCWLAEVRLALGPAEEKDSPGTVFWACTNFLGVRCTWCDNKVSGGCMMCVEQQKVMTQIEAKPEWPAWRSSLLTGDVDPAVLADWLEEHGFADATIAVRRRAEVA